MQRFIREVNTTNRACVLWDLAEDADYVIQVQSIGLHGESQASKRVHFRTLKETDRLPSNSSNQGDITVEGLDKERQLQTGEIVIIVAVLLMWAVRHHQGQRLQQCQGEGEAVVGAQHARAAHRGAPAQQEKVPVGQYHRSVSTGPVLDRSSQSRGCSQGQDTLLRVWRWDGAVHAARGRHQQHRTASPTSPRLQPRRGRDEGSWPLGERPPVPPSTGSSPGSWPQAALALDLPTGVSLSLGSQPWWRMQAGCGGPGQDWLQ
ncbi:PREDICTED: fibronectin type III domain-containing protein 4 isoform X1 [Gavialis gangeticus]|uniref:fibronectin type III domain-containing protein 4 isoform X1 n=1 Tax=Gavialis gangeticus TaxID=94835 RepID=UPI00092E7BDC|nr:PREDICTED: fibronectin type III domain-containing protein 4 isoform X1 [Gavialis gangeticus]XP_019376391.1 PREDICTED: fibronectin type III domain-containing protein 4 isoform X1 [Gavialis gangeticus]